MRHNFIILVCLVSALSCLSVPAYSAEEVQLSADSLVFDRDNGELKAEGDVRVLRGEMQLLSDSARWDETTGYIFSDGSVRMTTPDGTATADSLQYNFETGHGRMTNGRIELPGLAYLSGSEIETLGEENYRIIDGNFTSCEGEVPAWSFGARQIDVQLGHFARARHARFYLRGVPVLYLPYLAFPAKTERSSGLLMPTVGFSSRLGTRIVLPWYQIVDTDQDLTLKLEHMSRVGNGVGLGYRYFIATVEPARLNGNYVIGADGESDRYLVEWQHHGYLPADVRLVIDGQYVNADDYFELFGGSPQEYTQDRVQTTLYLSKAWEKTNLTGLARYTRAMQQDTSAVLQTLPEIGLNVVPQRFRSTPLFTSLDATVTNFWRQSGKTATRVRLLPGLSTDALSSRYLNILPTIAWREQFYQIGGTKQRAGRPEASVTLGNRFARIYQQPGSDSASRHAVELQLKYLYAPEVDTSAIPVFDFRDEFSEINRFRLLFLNRWTTRQATQEGAVYREHINLRMRVDYDLYEQQRTLGPAPDEHQPFSPLTAELEVRPHERIYLRGELDLAIEDAPGRMDALAVWGGYKDPPGNGLLLNYSYSRTEFEYAAVSADLALLTPFYANYEGRFDLRGQQNLDYRTSLEYRSGCWSVSGSWYERPGDRGVSFNFSLSNITGKTLTPLTTPLNDWL